MHCPYCKTTSFKKIGKFGKFTLLVCKKCGLGFIDPMPDAKSIKNLYSEKYFSKNHKEVCGYQSYEDMEKVLAKESERKLAKIKSIAKGKELLDIGCGLGIFLKKAKDAKFTVSGNDISSFAKKFISKLNIPFYEGSFLKNLPKKSFDMITAWDVVEHVPEVDKTFAAFNKAIKKNGYLFISTPDIESWDAKLFGNYWYGYKKIPEHLVFFSKSSIRKILSETGFEVIEISSWGFERDLNFIASKLDSYSPPLSKAAATILKNLSLGSISFFIPLTDMFVIARKNEDLKS